MTMKLPQKAGFVATPDEWDALVRIAENLAAQVVQRDAALMQMQAERAAARAEVARLTAALWRYAFKYDGASWYCAECGWKRGTGHEDGCEFGALRQPTPARLRCTCENFPDGEEEGEGSVMTIRDRNCPVHADTAPAQGQG